MAKSESKPKPTTTERSERKHTFNLVNMNEAQNALLRATRLMGIIDLHEAKDEREAIQQTIDAELTLMNAMIGLRHAPYPKS